MPLDMHAYAAFVYIITLLIILRARRELHENSIYYTSLRH